MTKKELINRGFKYIATQNNDNHTEVWARFSDWEDTIQYYYYLPKEDTTISNVMSISYINQVELFAIMKDKMYLDFINKSINFNMNTIWVDKENT